MRANLAVVGGTFGIALAPPNHLPSVGFYNSAALIGPVLIVALAVESRARAVWDSVPSPWQVEIVVALLVSETVALIAGAGALAGPIRVCTQHFSKDDCVLNRVLVGPTVFWSQMIATLVTAGLGAGFVAVVIVALVRRPRSAP